ncbi:MAG: 1-acyl-sn-glycerol-3-phosphate acyltransferase [Crocinitomicaceae bacterium]|nr:1-acyl-sn-glycerol-3-phosphate acyltransferase [Crocinitomicaceae bacterium]
MEKKKFIDLKNLIKSKKPGLAKRLPGFVLNYLRKTIHEDEINTFLDKHHTKFNHDFCTAIVDYLAINIQVKGIENIPKEGPVIIAMNHPLGGMDAIAFIHALKNHRADLKFIVNDILMNLENLKGLFVGINKHGKNEQSTRQNIIQAFESDEAICIFPAGLVSRKQHGKIEDLEWKKTFITYANKLNQPIIPVYIDGQLSNFFYRLANFRKAIGIKANIEMLYLADELFNQRNKTIHFTIGKSILPSDYKHLPSERKQAAFLKQTVYDLANK